MAQLFNELVSWQNVVITAAIGAVLFLALYFVLYRNADKSRSTRRGIVICGPSNTGKTTLFLAMAQTESEKPPTVPSIECNYGHTNGLSVVDVPGDATIREKLLEDACQNSRPSTFIFVAGKTDSANFTTIDASMLIYAFVKAIAHKASRFALICSPQQHPKVELAVREALKKTVLHANQLEVTGQDGITFQSSNTELLRHLNIDDMPESFSFEILPFDFVTFEAIGSMDETSGKLLEWIKQ